jgi:hypothetical protein
MRLAGFLFLGGGISLILTLSMLYIIVGVVLVVIGYYMTGLSVWNLFKSRRDKSIGETK